MSFSQNQNMSHATCDQKHIFFWFVSTQPNRELKTSNISRLLPIPRALYSCRPRARPRARPSATDDFPSWNHAFLFLPLHDNINAPQKNTFRFRIDDDIRSGWWNTMEFSSDANGIANSPQMQRKQYAANRQAPNFPSTPFLCPPNAGVLPALFPPLSIVVSFPSLYL